MKIKLDKVSYKFFLGMVALSSVILIIMSVLVKNSYANSLKRNEINFHVRSTSRTKDQFDFVMNLFDGFARAICSRDEVVRALNVQPQPAGEARADFSMNSYFQSLQQIQPFLGSIAIVGAQGQFYSSDVTTRRDDYERFYENYAAHFALGLHKDYFVGLDNSGLTQGRDHDMLTGVWPIYDVRESRLLGQLYLSLNYSLFQELFILLPITNNEKFMMIDTVGRIIFNYPRYVSFDAVLAAHPRIAGADEIIIEDIVFGVNSIIVSETSRVLGWKFIRIIDAVYVTPDTRKTQAYFNIVFIIAVAISLLVSVWLSRMLTRPVKNLFDACKRIESGDLTSRVSIATRDEMGQLGHTFNLIMDQINQNFERELIEQKRKDELRLEVLQAQINPHFLYNTLDSIKFLATLQEAHNIAAMCSSLINLLRYNLSSRSLASLHEEIESVKNYAGIQKYRYGDIFELKTDIDRTAEDGVISRFVLQPLVENALIHGFDDTESGGEIIIRAFVAEGALWLLVIDNGAGMNAETLDSINRGVKQNKPFDSIGINNIRERIRLQFGDKATLAYTSSVGLGAVATLRFPVSS
jgi:two-component system sensor histidine kinase YesM